MALTDKHCEACEGGVPALNLADINENMKELKGWDLEQGHLIKHWDFPDFKSALRFVNQIGTLAEEEGHHPAISFTWGKVRVELWTHAINGLSVNDFILAAKIDTLR